MSQTINIKQIAITEPILNAVKNVNSDIDVNNLTISKESEQGFGLSRMDRMMEANIDDLLESEPVEVKKIPRAGVKVNGKLQQLYTIVNGRHRIARAILTGKNDIPVNITGGQRQTKRFRKINKNKKDKKRRKNSTTRRKNNQTLSQRVE